MSTYAFKALDLSGTSTRGELEADDKQAVAAQLRSKGLIVLDIEEKKSAADVGDMLGALQEGEGAGADGRHAPALDDGVVRHVAPARAVRARGAGLVRQAARRA